MNWKGKVAFLGFLLAIACGVAMASTPTITLGAGHTGITMLNSLNDRTNAARSVIEAHTAVNGLLNSPTDVKVQWADGFAEVYRYFGPPNDGSLIWKELIYPQSMVAGGAGYYRYNGTGWVKVSYNCEFCFLYGEVGEVQQPPETSEP